MRGLGKECFASERDSSRGCRKERAVGKILVIGVTCADVVLRIDHLPHTAEDVIAHEQRMTLGGCAFNAFWVMHVLGEPAVLFSPIGTGPYGHFVRTSLAKEGITSPIDDAEGENGCCFCFVEPGGERTFIAHHGADYRYRREWFDRIDVDDIDYVYVCGLEIEEPSGPYIVDFLERRCAGKTIFFTPGPRPAKVPADLLDRIYDLHPILHLNSSEAQLCADRIAGEEMTVSRGASSILADRTGNTVFVTLGNKGCSYEAGDACGTVPKAPEKRIVDTIGAGDAHIGAVMACLHRGDGIEDAIACANHVCAMVVATEGAHPEAEAVRAAARG